MSPLSQHYEPLIHYLRQNHQAKWATQLCSHIKQGLCEQRYGDLIQWRQAFEQLPAQPASVSDLQNTVSIGLKSDLSQDEYAQLKKCLEALIPWRKGPFSLFDIHLDAEWRSDWKWERILPHIEPLNNKRVLDIGCGNGYHCLRIFGAGAARVIGIDPSPRFTIQFLMIKHYLGSIPVDVLPIGIEQLPSNLEYFDTAFSMGVLYHRRSPMDHLRELKTTLKPGGQLVLETLIIEGKEGECLVPEGRYAMMRNVWFIPSALTLISWLKKCGFKQPKLVDQAWTTTEEQRATEWMRFQSLADFMNPNDPTQTAEGHPAPLRGTFVAYAPQ